MGGGTGQMGNRDSANPGAAENTQRKQERMQQHEEERTQEHNQNQNQEQTRTRTPEHQPQMGTAVAPQ